MSSVDGALYAMIEVGLMDDRKVRRLARLQGDPVRTAVSVVLYLAAVLESWRDDEPALCADAAPAWFTYDPSPFVAELVAVGLLDDEGRVVRSSLERRMSPFRARRDQARAAARKRWGTEPTDAVAVPTHSGSTADAMQRTYVRTHPRTSRAPARETTDAAPPGGGGPAPVGEVQEQLRARWGSRRAT